MYSSFIVYFPIYLHNYEANGTDTMLTGQQDRKAATNR